MEKINNGYIKIHRSMLDWEWWDDINTFRLFMTILLMANWKGKKWHGKTIKRGQVWTSLPTLANKSGLTLQQTRTALEHLKSTGEVTDKSTRGGRLITVANYGKYQSTDFQSTDKLTDKLTDNQQTSNRRPTVTEERKEIYKKGEQTSPTDEYLFFKDFV